MTDPPGKARHATLMLLAAGALADCAPEEAQKRALARYCFLFGEAALEWLRPWRNQLKRSADDSLSARGREAEPAVKALAAALSEAGEVRHHLAAKRQSAAEMRADDMDATRLLWLAVNPTNVQAIGWAAIEAFETMRDDSLGAPILEIIGLPDEHRRAIADALPRRDPSRWYLAADTAADLREYTLPAAGGGELGRRIAQINDVAAHLDTLLAIAPICEQALIYDWLVRSAMVVELNALLDLALGPPPNHPRNVIYPLLDLCRNERTAAAHEELVDLRDAIGAEGWNYVRLTRNKIGAHIDSRLTMYEIHEHLLFLDYSGIARLARVVLDRLDAIGAGRLGLELLLLGERRIDSWPTDPSEPGPGRPRRTVLTGNLSRSFRQLDSPYMTVSGGGLGSAVLMGMTSSRRPQPRSPVAIAARRPDRWVEPLRPPLIRDKNRSGSV
jgi:hypothetical protein